MFRIYEMIMPKSIEEAYEQYITKKRSKIIGGGVFLRLSQQQLKTGIDLSLLGLDSINETDTQIEIGAMTNLRELETNQALNNEFNGIISNSVKNIVGVQLRNIATIGGTVAARYGFSDLITALMVLDTKLVFYKHGEMSLEAYMAMKKPLKDILMKIILIKDNKKASFKQMRNSESDFAILNVAVSKSNDAYKVAIGARPHRSIVKKYTNLDAFDINDYSFGSNIHGSKTYREQIAPVLVKRGFEEVDNEY